VYAKLKRVWDVDVVAIFATIWGTAAVAVVLPFVAAR
jgi:hypothetical protein